MATTEVDLVGYKATASRKDSMPTPPPPAYDNFTFENEDAGAGVPQVKIKTSTKKNLPASRQMYDDIDASSEGSSGAHSSGSSPSNGRNGHDVIKMDDIDLNQLKQSQLDNELEGEKVVPVRLTWQDIDVIARPKTNVFGTEITPERKIIKGVSGFAEPGTTLAVMGSSGAGKSTLLNVLTQRNIRGLKINGEILCNGVNLQHDITGISAYVQQDDMFMGELTVKEHLTFTARLRLGDAYTEKEKSKRVQTVMSKCSLKKCETVQIGTPGRSKTISGGEMKRLSVASELLENPSILFLDEPTSGLDSYLAEVIVTMMKDVTKTNCSVICTIHQPSSEVFKLFDRVMLLSMGEVFFHGSTADAARYFSDIGRPVPENYNPADHYINELSVIPGRETESKAILAKRFETFRASQYQQEVMNTIKETKADTKAIEAYRTVVKGEKGKKTGRYRVGTFSQFEAVFIRALKSVFRDPVLFKVKPIQMVVVAVLVGLIYLRVPFGRPYRSHEVDSVSGGLFIVITNTSLTIGFTVLNVFPTEINLFRRDHFNGMYSVATYYLAKNLAELPLFIGLATMYTVVVYFMFGLYPSAEQFFIFWGIVLLTVNASISFYYMISVWAPTHQAALAVGPACLLPLLLLGGFFIQPSQVPCFIYWIRYLSWFYYAFQLFMKNQWRKVDYFGCPQFFPEGIPNSTYGNVNAQGSLYFFKNETGYDLEHCKYKDGITYMEGLKIFVGDEGLFWGLLTVLFVGYRLIALLILYYKVRDSTR